MIYHGIVHTQYIFGGKDATGSWRPNEEDSSTIQLELIRTDEDPVDDRLSPGQLFRAYCSDRFTTITLMQLTDPFASISDDLTDDESTGSANSMRLASQWLKTCQDEHIDCKEDCKPLLPTRIIDVQMVGKSPNPRVYVKSAKEERARYAALSHCWGEQPIITTTSANLEAHRNGIKWTALSKTFQDAIKVCRDLKIRYLWIDSLCILQDSAEDWEMESAEMGRIYRDAMLTLSAAHAENGAGGLFVQRDAKANRPCKMSSGTARRRPRKTRKLFESPKKAESALYASPFTYSWPTGPLYTRAWVYQEQALSRRTLAFGRDNMYWRCQTMLATENEPEGGLLQYVPDMPDSRFYRFMLSRTKADQNTTRSESDQNSISASDSGEEDFDDPAQLYDMWCDIVAEYSKRSITKTSDRLPALAGLAAEVHSSLDGDHYIAGMWHQDAPRCLMWLCQGNEGSRKRTHPPQAYVAPTWSWASVSGCLTSYDLVRPILRDNEDAWHEELEILSFTRRLKGHSPFAEVTAGLLRMKGRFLDVLAKPDPEQITSQHPIEEQGNIKTLCKLEDDSHIGNLNLDELAGKVREVTLLAMLSSGESRTMCLALGKAPLQSTADMHYTRIGTASVETSLLDSFRLDTVCIW